MLCCSDSSVEGIGNFERRDGGDDGLKPPLGASEHMKVVHLEDLCLLEL